MWNQRQQFRLQFSEPPVVTIDPSAVSANSPIDGPSDPTNVHASLQAALLEDFLLPMLDYDPMHRATAKECLSHPWLTYTSSHAD